MVFFQLVVAALEFGAAQLVRSRLGVAGLLLLTCLVVGIRADSARLVWWSAGLFFLLTLQMQA
ncbi:hypothetical protein GFH48_22130 [Streptomyces fagopyri]|uniref:Uncharacterized protein n=1 Tax=Streptomyces fagopyri TaxID=2662397 RepID=A0A5Q0LFI3_9ACTN|nr:hypothetical protein [Streptomyces fagopyri]QFZ75601.1 hypothetical protein GFH48_22130 [Streptomyces fagopyri]